VRNVRSGHIGSSTDSSVTAASASIVPSAADSKVFRGTISSPNVHELITMTDLNPYRTRLRRQLADVAMSTSPLEERATAVLETLARAIPFDTAWLGLRDPEQRRHTSLATVGPADPLRRYFSTPDADDELEQLGLHHRRPPMLASEIPLPLPELRAWSEYLLPAGLRGGLAAGLFTPDGRHIGFLSLHTEDAPRLDAADRQLIANVANVIASGLDRAQEMADAARMVRAAEAGVVLTRGGDTEPLPGLPSHRLLVAGSTVLAAAAAELADGATYGSFLTPTTGPDGAGLLRVTALNCARPDLDHLTAAVLLSPPGDLCGLTPRDLRLLGLVTEGVIERSALAVRLGLDERTVGDALAAAQAALRAPDLTATATYAIRTGLRIPPQLDT
jgi:hypothetical protein